MFTYLEKYKIQGSFEFSVYDNLNSSCNTPKHSSGLYIIYKEKVSLDNLIYIGISGRVDENGNIIHRKDGLGGRITRGKQFGEARRNSWPKKMQSEGISKIIVQWFITHGEFNSDDPRVLEQKLLALYLAHKGELPNWNMKI